MSLAFETDLYPPVLAWLESAGYTVHAEVNSCDIAARRGSELAVIELKRALNLDLILQAVRRQETAASVYVAVPAPQRQDKRWRDCLRLLKRLEIGLILVHLSSALPRAELVFHPLEQPRRKNSRAAKTAAPQKRFCGKCRDGRSTSMSAVRRAAVW